MSTGILNPYIQIEPPYTYPQKFYHLQDLVGNIASTSNNLTMYSNVNNVIESNVGSMGIIRCEKNTSSHMLFRPPILPILGNRFTMQFYAIAPPSSSSRTRGAKISLGVDTVVNLSNTQSYFFETELYESSICVTTATNENRTRTLADLRYTASTMNWNHYQVSFFNANLSVFYNGTRLFETSTLASPVIGASLSNKSATIVPQLSNIVITSNSTVPFLIADLKITREYTKTQFTPPPAPFLVTPQTHALVTGEFNPLYHRKFFSNTSGVYNFIPNVHNYPGPANDIQVWRGWVLSNTQSSNNFFSGSGPYTIAPVTTDGTAPTSANCNVTANTYVPISIYGNRMAAANTCTLNGVPILWSSILSAPLPRRFRMYTETGNPIALVTPFQIGSTNLRTASNIGLSNGSGGYLTTGFVFGTNTTSDTANLSYTWNFRQTSPLTFSLSNSVSFVANVYIEIPKNIT